MAENSVCSNSDGERPSLHRAAPVAEAIPGAAMAVTKRDQLALAKRALALKLWYCVYLAMWLGGIVGLVFAFGYGFEPATTPALTVFLSSIVPYLICMILAAKVQGRMHSMGVYKHAGEQVVVAMFLLNPYVLGFYVPLSVLLAYGARKGQIAFKVAQEAAIPVLSLAKEEEGA